MSDRALVRQGGQQMSYPVAPSNNGLELSDDEKMALERLSGIDKAAILMLSLSEEDAAALFRNLQPKQVQKLPKLQE